MRLAYAHVTVSVYDTREHAGSAWNELRLRLYGLNLGPLEHRLDAGSEPTSLSLAPHLGYVLVELLILLKCWALERGVLAIAADDGQVMVLHRWASFE